MAYTTKWQHFVVGFHEAVLQSGKGCTYAGDSKEYTWPKLLVQEEGKVAFVELTHKSFG